VEKTPDKPEIFASARYNRPAIAELCGPIRSRALCNRRNCADVQFMRLALEICMDGRKRMRIPIAATAKAAAMVACLSVAAFGANAQ
jgi:hypothetical protein